MKNMIMQGTHCKQQIFKHLIKDKQAILVKRQKFFISYLKIIILWN